MAPLLASLALSALSLSVAAAKPAVREDRELIVAIYGGGVASATLAQSLKDLEHIHVEYYDPALNLTPTSFRLLGLDPKVHDALALVGDEASGMIERAGWYPEEPSIVIVGQGEEADKVVLDWAELKNTTHHPQVSVVDPAPFLMQMLNGTSEKQLHANKTLVSVVRNDEAAEYPLELTFSDGTTQDADVLIGDDGPVGFTRSHVLGATHPATFPVFMNFLSAVAHVPPEEAKKHLGRYGDKNSGRRFERVGKGSWFLDAYLDGFFTCLGSFYTEEAYDVTQFVRATSEHEIDARFSSLAGGDGITSVLKKFSGLRLIPELEHLPAPTYVNGLVAMQGNAAHLMTNFQQLGPSQQIEDAMVLGALLRKAKTHADIEAALHAYDAVRPTRAHWMSEHGKKLGWLWMGMVEGVGIDAKKLRKAIIEWKEQSEAFDLKAHRDEALKIFEQKREADKEAMAKKQPHHHAGLQDFLGEEVKEWLSEQMEL